jgi:hypothetical protein
MMSYKQLIFKFISGQVLYMFFGLQLNLKNSY